MRISEAKTTSKGVLTLSDIKGVDLSSSPMRVKSTRASYMKNMICKGGVNHKRNGFEEIASFYDEDGKPLAINGIITLGRENDDTIFVHAGNKMYLAESDFSVVYDCGEIGVNKKGMYFFNDGEACILAGNKLFFYNGHFPGETDEPTICQLFDSKKAYIPTTSIGITDDMHGSLSQPYEGVNLFSSKRINKLTGAKDDSTITKNETTEIWDAAQSRATFYLDGEINLEKDIRISATIDMCGNEEAENSMPLWFKTDGGFEKGLADITFEISERGDKLVLNGKGIARKSNKSISAFYNPREENEPVEFTAEIRNKDGHGVVVFSPCLLANTMGEDNITVEYCTKKKEPRIKAACECSVNSYNKIIAIATEDDVVYYSSPSEGYSYFPDNNYLRVVNNISSLIAGGDFLGVASKDELAIVSFSIDSSGEKIECVPNLIKKHKDVGCSNGYSQAYLEGDTLFLSYKGVYGASKDGVHMRSGNINKELTLYDNKALESAHALEHDGRYYLFIDGRVYIADARYKTYESDRLDVSYEYEWWRWENCPCRVAVNFNGRLLVGREDGRIMAMSEGYSDTTYYKLDSSEVLTDGNSFDFNEEIDIGENGRIKIKGAKCSVVTLESIYLYKSNGELQITLDVGDLITLMQRGAMEPGKELVFRCDEKEFRFTVASYDLETGQIIGENHEGELFHQGITVYMDSLEEFSFEKNDEGEYHLYNAYGEKVSFIDFDSMTAVVTKSVPVECEIHTALFNFAADMKKKTIHKIAFVPGASTSGEIQIGYETDKRSKLVGQAVGSELDFSSLNFDNFTFDSTVLKSFEKRVHERNVQFIKFRLLSLEDADFSIESLNVIYSTNSR